MTGSYSASPSINVKLTITNLSSIWYNRVCVFSPDIRKVNNQAVRAVNTGMIILGGGLIKHHICNANLMVREYNVELLEHDVTVCYTMIDLELSQYSWQIFICPLPHLTKFLNEALCISVYNYIHASKLIAGQQCSTKYRWVLS